MDHLHSFLSWVQNGIQGNLVASIICLVVAWFWKIKPHFEKIHQHNKHVAMRLEQIHKRVKVAK